MFGNLLGWKISAAILAGVLLFAVWLQAELQITPPTNLSLDPKNLAPLEPPVPTEPIVDQSQPGDAGEKYRDAIATYDDFSDALDQFAKDPRGTPPLPIQDLLDATHLSDMKLFSLDPSQLVDYQSDHPPLDHLNDLGHRLAVAGLLLVQRKDFSVGVKFLEAEYSLGFKLYQERLTYDEYLKGMGLMDEALQGLADSEGLDPARGKICLDQMAALMAYNSDRVTPVYTVLASADPKTIELNAGDVFRFSRIAQERLFRVEAILKLGRYRYDASRKADQLAAPRYLRQLASDPDPIIQSAAKAAANLTIEQYRMIH